MTTTTHHPDTTFRSKTCASFSIVVDDVDARATGDDSHMLHKLLTDTSLDIRKCSQSQCKEESNARIRQIQVEAESRKMEFARLLEEHAQVIKKLKQMEEDGAALHA
ncbi:uncharacterized protein LOC124352685 isoform X1 [Homalodisca vitripennis]|uniref:uncharacterized protein LOC124352685 isoform X1 n=1 Tax=Homalodisca vitripennis TaxID=197043 RepID=UPI001EEA9622|nr:uncharacterized protein LOC124352685 isoform X1 [Homalodisca vitripennis]